VNYVHLSPHFPPNFHLFSVNLARLGVTVLGLGDEPYDHLAPELRAALAGYYRVGDMHHYDELVRGCGYFTHQFGKIDRIDSHVEYWMETEAGLRDDFNAAGPRRADVAGFKRKSWMKEAFARAGVPAGRGAVVKTLSDAQELVAQTGYPVVAKPDMGVGAANTFRIESDAELERFWATRPPVDYLLEEFIEGTICTFDGLADREGNPAFIGSLQYSHGIMETVNEDRHIYFFTQREIPADLDEAGRRTLREFGVRERFFHIEFFRKADGSLVALEANIRPPGGPVLDVYNYASDVDLYWGWASVVTGNRFQDDYHRRYHVCYVGRKWNKPYAHSHDEVMDAFGRIIVHHQPISPVFSLAMGDYAYLVRTPEKEEMLAATDYIQELVS
jgi:hypothetical protein